MAAAVASRSSLVGALLRTAAPATRESLFPYLQGLSRDELECIAEFQGACIIETCSASQSEYRILADFFASADGGRWADACERAHKTFVVLEWLDLRKSAARSTISFALS